MVNSWIFGGEDAARGSFTLGYDLPGRGQADEAAHQEIIVMDLLKISRAVSKSVEELRKPDGEQSLLMQNYSLVVGLSFVRLKFGFVYNMICSAETTFLALQIRETHLRYAFDYFCLKLYRGDRQMPCCLIIYVISFLFLLSYGRVILLNDECFWLINYPFVTLKLINALFGHNSTLAA